MHGGHFHVKGRHRPGNHPGEQLRRPRLRKPVQDPAERIIVQVLGLHPLPSSVSVSRSAKYFSTR